MPHRFSDRDVLLVTEVRNDFLPGAAELASALFEAIVVEDACRAIDTQGSLAPAWARMHQAGVQRSTVAAVLS